MDAGGRAGVSKFSVAITNRSTVAAWLDIRYTSSYAGADGRVVATHEGVIKQILQPGETREWRDLADGDLPDGATAATMTITGAERAIPAGLKSSEASFRLFMTFRVPPY